MLLYADRYVYKYHSIITKFIINYEKQTLITGIKSNQCTIYHVKPAKRKNLTQKYLIKDKINKDRHGNLIERSRMRTY
jgi:hypothetical protein